MAETGNPLAAAALLVDIQQGCIARMQPEDAKAYLEAVAETVTDLRARGIPLIWTVISNKHKFHAPVPSNLEPRVRHINSLTAMRFFRGPDPDNYHLFHDFITQHGPRTDEAVLEKKDIPTFVADKNGRDAAADHLRALGARTLMVMGAMSTYCVLEAAAGAALQNFNVFMCNDRVVSWADDAETQAVWDKRDAWHRGQITRAAKLLMSDSTRRFLDNDILALQGMSVFDYETAVEIVSHPSLLSAVLAAKPRKIPFPSYEKHGVTVTYRAGGFIELRDQDRPAGIVGTTQLNRNPLMLTRLASASAALLDVAQAPVSVLFGACSVGHEPWSFAKALHDQGMLEKNINVYGLDVSAAFIACARGEVLPVQAAEKTDASWNAHLIMEGQAGTLRVSPTLTGAVVFHDAEDIRDHEGVYDAVVLSNALYHMPFAVFGQVLEKAAGMTRALIVLDDASYRSVAADKAAALLLDDAGFYNLNAIVAGRGDISASAYVNETGEAVFLCRGGVALPLAEKCRRAPGWRPAP